jgi:hypothetical protein
MAPVSLGEIGMTSRSAVKAAPSASGAVGPLPSIPRIILNETLMCSKSTHEVNWKSFHDFLSYYYSNKFHFMTSMIRRAISQ